MNRGFSRVRFISLAALSAVAVLSPWAVGDQILETLSASLTDYKASKTGVQDVRPQVSQRGVNLDGSPRGTETFETRGAFHGNPYENFLNSAQLLNGIRLDTGTYAPTAVDLSLPAPGFRWTIGRSYNARQDDSGHHDSDGYQGKNWFQNSQPEIVYYDDPSDPADDIVYIVYGADRFAEFKRYDATSPDFKGKNGAAGVVSYSSGSPDTYTWTCQIGVSWTFMGFNTAGNKANGQLWKLEDADGNVAYVGDSSTASTAVTSGYDSGGRILKAYDAADRRFTYTYTTLNSVDRLTKVVAETKTGGTWASPTGVTEVGKVEYGYYGNETYGDAGDLKLVTITTPLTDSGVSDIRKQYYRYWEGTFDDNSNPGHPHAIKLFLDFEGTRNFDWGEAGTESPEAFDDGFTSASHSTLEPYASAYFEYDSSHRIDRTWANGDCGCSGGANGTHELEYETNSSYTDNSGYDTTWARRTVVKRPDDSYLTQVFDETGQALHRLVTDVDPDTTLPPPEKWVTNVTRDASGVVTSVGSPASVASYTHSTGSITSNSSAGLIRTYTRASSGDMTGFLTDQKYKTGSSGTEYFELSLTWTSATKAFTDVTVTRPMVASRREYSEAISSGTTGSYLTTYSFTTYGAPDNLTLETLTTTYPAVSTSNNGSGTASVRSAHFKKDGTVDFEKAEDGVITYRAYTNGQRTTLCRDADTASLSPPTGFSSSGTELDHITSTTFDAQGRRDTVTLPNGRIHKWYYSKLGDRRLVTLHYPKFVAGSPDTFYGPVDLAIMNHAGSSELSGMIAFAGNTTTTAMASHIDEADDDPITAVDTGTLEKMTVSLFDKTGSRLTERRVFFDIPSSGAGTDAANYDPTLLGYDDSGQRTRGKEPSGTIYRTEYDLLGRVTEHWIGTNDSSFDGGEPTGTDNMVKTRAVEYDSGNDGGNGYLTKRTLYVQDGESDKRVTTFSHDVRGNVLLEARPVAPPQFYKLDNMNRVIAIGGFSSTASIVVGTDDPSTETSNRVSLKQSFFDERGRMWKSQRHEIDASDGSDDDNLQHTRWFDATGGEIKADGEQLVKATYDRLGRVTHRFILANDNDSAYADADDVLGDVVLEEHQTTIEADGDHVVMHATISRFHDDYGIVKTTGVLDTNADGDDLKYTAANLEGRIQITAMWYDSLGRLQDQVAYGTYGGSDFDRDGLSVPARSDTRLRSTYTYYDDGDLKEMEDPKGFATRYEYDDAGQRTKVIANYTDGTPGGGTNEDEDQVVEYEYTDGLRTKITAKMPSSSDDQETLYIHGTTDGTPSSSEISTGHLLRAIKYPDSTNTGTTEGDINSDSSDVLSYAYNAQGDEIYAKDQAGNVFETDFDDGGREEHRRVTTLASGFDGAVRRISTTYTSVDQVELVTQYDNATVGSGTVVDEVKYTYDGWGNVTKFEQDRNSAVGASGSVDDYEVSYTYEKATDGRNTVRRSDVTLPGAKTYDFHFSEEGGQLDDDASRVTAIRDGTTELSVYAYLGNDRLTGTTYDEPDVFSQRYGATSSSFPDLDRFNRETSSRWTKDLSVDVDFCDIDIAYDRNSNITSVADNVHSAFDVTYTMDDLNRLIQSDEGTRLGDEIWQLSQSGNWDVAQLDLDDDGLFTSTDEYDDTRTHNDANELTARDVDSDNTDDYTLTYDAVGNLTDDAEAYEYEYDAFGRLRKVNDTADQSLVAEYKYNGLGYRISIHEDSDTDGDVDASDKWFHATFDERWRIVATYREDDTDPKERFVPQNAGANGLGGSSYIDAVAFRDKDANTGWTDAADGTLEERVYYCQNWRADLSAIVSSAGEMVEWAKFSPYGMPFGMPFGDADSDGDRDSADETQVSSWSAFGPYDVRGDVDLDGDTDSSDLSSVAATTATLGRASLSDIGNHLGYAGYRFVSTESAYVVRHRVFRPLAGRWGERDPLEYADGLSLYEYVASNPVANVDPQGTLALCHNLARYLPLAPGNSCDLYDPCDHYHGVNSRCFCKCIGSGRWHNYVRTCLLCHHVLGRDKNWAHLTCYLGGMVYPTDPVMPSSFWFSYCATKCRIIQVLRCY